MYFFMLLKKVKLMFDNKNIIVLIYFNSFGYNNTKKYYLQII